MSDVPSDWKRASIGPTSELSTSLRALSDEFRARAESKDGEDIDDEVSSMLGTHTGTF